MSEVKIACVGDVMCGESFYALGQGVASSLDKYGKDFLTNEIVDVLRNHDLVLCNIECVLSDVGRKEHSLRSLHMRGRAEAARHLADWGITVAHVANNHILEQGFEAAVDTVQQLEQAGIKIVGSGKDGGFQPGIQITEVTLNNQEISVLGICFLKEKYAYYGGAELNELLNAISSLARQGKTVVVSVHWGNELIDRPNTQQRQIARQFVAAGASLIVGHHPHVVQGIEKVNGGLVAYSLGNFIFDCFLSHTRWSVILSVTMSGQEIIQWDYIPIENDKEHRPKFAQGKREIELKKEIERRCDLLQSKIPCEQYEKQYESDFRVLDSISRHKLWLELAKRIPTLRFIYWPQLLLRPIQRRLGIW